MHSHSPFAALIRGYSTSRAIALAAVLGAIGCCQPAPTPQFLVAGQWPSRAEFVSRFGEPTVQEETTIGTLAERHDLTHWDVENVQAVGDDFRSRLRKLPPEQRVEWVVWEGKCLFRRTYRIAGVFDPESGKLVVVEGEALLDDWYRTS
jgi:hypothetical protein